MAHKKHQPGCPCCEPQEGPCTLTVIPGTCFNSHVIFRDNITVVLSGGPPGFTPQTCTTSAANSYVCTFTGLDHGDYVVTASKATYADTTAHWNCPNDPDTIGINLDLPPDRCCGPSCNGESAPGTLNFSVGQVSGTFVCVEGTYHACLDVTGLGNPDCHISPLTPSGDVTVPILVTFLGGADARGRFFIQGNACQQVGTGWWIFPGFPPYGNDCYNEGNWTGTPDVAAVDATFTCEPLFFTGTLDFDHSVSNPSPLEKFLTGATVVVWES